MREPEPEVRDVAAASEAPAERPLNEIAPEFVCAPKPEVKHSAAAQADDSLVFDPVARSSLAEDSMYREIFSGMALDVLIEMRQAIEAFPSDADAAQATLTSEAERLRFAAEQIGLREWRDALAAFAARAGAFRRAGSVADHTTDGHARSRLWSQSISTATGEEPLRPARSRLGRFAPSLLQSPGAETGRDFGCGRTLVEGRNRQ